MLDITDLQSVKLIDSSHLNDRYVALSHCWGTPATTFVTSKTTIAARREGFDVEEAPKTFRDAILVAHRLGICYLWIDSLCIIQGDASDWATEASRMAAVYSNAYLTIAAANADDDSKGFLTSRPFAYTTLNIVTPAGDSTTVFLQRGSGGVRNPGERVEPVDTRAWILQEQWLSHRTLRFGTDQISWSCFTQIFAEVSSEPLGSSSQGAMLFQVMPSWNEIVTIFSRRRLSYDVDKFPALAGVAESTNSRRSPYCAGMWWDEMPNCLLWETSQTGPPLSEYIAPSWSWAAVNGPIAYPPKSQCSKYIMLPQVKFLGYHIQTDVENPYGRLTEPACLKLKAPLRLLSLSNQKKADGSIFFHFAKSSIAGMIINGRIDRAYTGKTETFGLILTYTTETTPKPSASMVVWTGTVPVRRSNQPTANPYGGNKPKEARLWRSLHGLLLCRAEAFANGFERVGVFHFNLLPLQAARVLQDSHVKEVHLY